MPPRPCGRQGSTPQTPSTDEKRSNLCSVNTCGVSSKPKVDLEVAADVFSLFCQKRQSPEAQPYYLIVEGVELAHRWNVHQFVAKQHHISLERTAGRDPPTQKVGQAGILNFNAVNCRSNRLQGRLQPVAQASRRLKICDSHGIHLLLRGFAITLPRNRGRAHGLSPQHLKGCSLSPAATPFCPGLCPGLYPGKQKSLSPDSVCLGWPKTCLGNPKSLLKFVEVHILYSKVNL